MDASDLHVEIVNQAPSGGMWVGRANPDIRVTHIPTGIVAVCGTARSQHRNRAICIAMIEAALEYGESSK